MERKKIAALSIFLVIIYLKIFSGFFQQDEWFGFGWYILHRNLNIIDTFKFLFAPGVGHYNPLNLVLQTLFLSIWGIDYTKFAILSVLLHVIVTIAVYFLAKKIFKENKLLAMATAVLFGFFAAPFQSTAWVIVDIAIQMATLFGIISTILFFKFLETKKFKYLIYSLLILISSLLFKEITIGLFPLFLFIYLFSYKDKGREKGSLLIMGFGIVYVLARVAMFFAPNITGDKLITQSISADKIFYNFVTVPFKSITQIIIPSDVIKLVLSKIALIFPQSVSGGVGTPQFEMFIVEKLMEVFSVGFGLFVLLLGLRYKKILLLGVFWVILNSFIFSFAPEGPGIINAIDSRNLYFTSTGMAIFMVYLVHLIVKENRRKFAIVMSLIIIFNICLLIVNLRNFTEVGAIRKNILTQIKKDYPILPNKIIFYSESDSSYYGLPSSERTLPFQSGFGQVLLIWYSFYSNFPPSFYQNRFLWDIKDQGYKEDGGIGFGYFRDFEKLMSEIGKNKIDKDSVIAYSFDSLSNSVQDITDQIRGRIEGYQASKKLINRNSYKITASQNNENVFLISDGKRETLWDSHLTYENLQYINFDLTKNHNIAEVIVDSYNNQDQNQVGYRVDVSDDGKIWRTVFESKRYPPGDDGKVKIYFKPTMTRYLKLEQIGFHHYASWVIGEVEIYEAI